MTFSVRDHAFIKISPTKGVVRFGMQGKWNPRFIGPFEVLQLVDPAIYRVALPLDLTKVYDVFHMSLLYKYNHDPANIINYPPLDLRKEI